MNSLISYFDLYSSIQTIHPSAHGGGTPTRPSQSLQYLFLTLGIIVQPLIVKLQAGGALEITIQEILYRILFALIIGLAIFPAVYRNAFDPNKPGLVQYASIFASGLGYQSLMQPGILAVAKAAGAQ